MITELLSVMMKRDKIALASAIAGAALLMWNLQTMFFVLPDEAMQGPIYRLLFFHVPAWWTAFLAVTVAAAASIGYLSTRRLAWDAVAVAFTEVAVVFLVTGLLLGSIWGRVTWGIWWTWDARLTSALICVLLYAGYLALRTSVHEPHRRAVVAGVFSLLAFADVPIVWYSIRWWRTQHPQPMELEPEMMRVLMINWLAIMLIAAALILARIDQERISRRIDTLRLNPEV
jgi:heme exporter protein C